MSTALMIQLTLWQVVVDFAWTAALIEGICAAGEAAVAAPSAAADVLDVAHSSEAKAAAERTVKVPTRKSKGFASARRLQSVC